MLQPSPKTTEGLAKAIAMLATKPVSSVPLINRRGQGGIPKRGPKNLYLQALETQRTVHEHKCFQGKPRIKFVDITRATYIRMLTPRELEWKNRREQKNGS